MHGTLPTQLEILFRFTYFLLLRYYGKADFVKNQAQVVLPSLLEGISDDATSVHFRIAGFTC
jgi:hypothetical protein